MKREYFNEKEQMSVISHKQSYFLEDDFTQWRQNKVLVFTPGRKPKSLAPGLQPAGLLLT